MVRTPLNRGGKVLSIEETIARLAAFRESHPTRYLGLAWRGVAHGITRSVFAAPAATDADLVDQFRDSQQGGEWAYATQIPFGTNGVLADAWLNER